METNSAGMEEDKRALIAIIEEMAGSMTGAQSTKHWADNALWFDVAPFASKGIRPARKAFDEAFGQLQSCGIEILETETFLNGDMGVVCSVQRWNIVRRDGMVGAPMLVRQTDCFEKQDGEWKVIHEHSSVPTSPDWDGKIVTGEE
jgi:Ketosteroid isomerase homolog